MTSKRCYMRNICDTDGEFITIQELTGSPTSIPAFLIKLWTLVDDPVKNDVICWDSKGKSFHILDQRRFAKELLPVYFKHNNISSFIRQLNMYGFRKLLHVEHGSMRMEQDNLEFYHTYFLRGEMKMLEMIKRKPTAVKLDVGSLHINSNDVSHILQDVTQIKEKQDSLNSTMLQLRRENEALWREVAHLRQKQKQQQNVVTKLLQFLLPLLNSRHRAIPNIQRKCPLMIEAGQEVCQPSVPQPPEVSKSEPPPSTLMSSIVVTDLLKPLDVNSSLLHSVLPSIMDDKCLVSMPTVSQYISVSQPSSACCANAGTHPSLTPDLTVMTYTPSWPPSSLVDADSRELVLRTCQDKQFSSSPASLKSAKDVNDQVELVQTEIDSLRDVLISGQYSLEPSVFQGLFDPQTFLPHSQLHFDSAVATLDPGFIELLSGLPEEHLPCVRQSDSDPTLPTNQTDNELSQYRPPEFSTLLDDQVTMKVEDDEGILPIMFNVEDADFPIQFSASTYDFSNSKISADELD